MEAFLANGQIPEFSNPAKIFFMINETGCAGAIDYTGEIKASDFLFSKQKITSLNLTSTINGLPTRSTINNIFMV
jgi:hypothetical protein